MTIDTRVPPGRTSPLLDVVDDIVATVIAPSAGRVDAEHLFPAEGVAALAEAGLGILQMTPDLGGVGTPTWIYAEALMRISAACGSTSTVYMTQMHCGHPIRLRGTAEQQQRWIPPLCNGTAIGGIALTEPNAGSDVATMRTTARPDRDGFRVRGSKTFISNGDRADVIVLFATVDPRQGKDGISAFLLDTASLEGFSTGIPMRKLGQRGASTVELHFDDCLVPRSAVLGDIGSGYPLLLDSVTASRISAAAQGVGFAEGAYQALVAHAHSQGLLAARARDAQDLQFALARIRSEIYAARSMLLDVCDLVDAYGDEASAQVSMAKLHCTGIGVRLTAQCVELLGEDGDLVEVGVERRLRDAKVAEIYDGTSQVQSMLVARDIRLHASSKT